MGFLDTFTPYSTLTRTTVYKSFPDFLFDRKRNFGATKLSTINVSLIPHEEVEIQHRKHPIIILSRQRKFSASGRGRAKHLELFLSKLGPPPLCLHALILVLSVGP